MSELLIARSSAALLPLPEVDFTTRPGTLEDVKFIDSLQKKQSKQVGFLPTAAIEGKIRLGHVLIAEESLVIGHSSLVRGRPAEGPTNDQGLRTNDSLGYLIGNDQYFKRDDLGCIFQMNVVESHRRKLVAASLLKAQFERSAYGCKMYCCWCAQDIEANRFWESMGFVALAYRVGSMRKGKRREAGGVREEHSSVSSLTPHAATLTPRIHIFWQKRIRSGDTTTPWWFPSKTAGGAIREDRIVLPIPHGTHWSDAKPLILPGVAVGGEEVKKLPSPRSKKSAPPTVDSKATGGRPPTLPLRNGLRFDIPRQGEPLPEDLPVKRVKEKPVRVKTVCDPRLIGAARELRDRWLERSDELVAPAVGKYDVTRRTMQTRERPALPGAMAA